MTMITAAKARGANWEKRIADFLNGERRRTHGKVDLGDISGLPGIVIECKAQREFQLSVWLDQLQKEVDNASADLGFLVVKRPGTTKPEKAYWIVDPRHILTILDLYYSKVNEKESYIEGYRDARLERDSKYRV